MNTQSNMFADGEQNALADLLQRHFAGNPLDGAYSQSLLERLTRELSVRPAPAALRRAGNSRRARALAVAWTAAVIILAAIGISRWQSGPRQVTNDDYSSATPAPPRRGVEHASAPGAVIASGPGALRESFGFPTVAQQVGMCDLIVRGRIASIDGGLVTYAVSHVVYGDFAQKEIVVDRTNSLEPFRTAVRDKLKQQTGKEPAEKEILEAANKQNGAEVGRNVIVYLRRLQKTPDGQPTFLMNGTTYDVPPDHRLDDVEKNIIAALRDGQFAEPNISSGSFLRQQLSQAPLVVVAELSRVDDRTATWKVEQVVAGESEKKVLVVDHDLFARRARALAAAELRAAGKSPVDPKALAKRTAARTAELVKEELKVGARAILFVAPPAAKVPTLDGRVLYRLYETAKNKDHFQNVLDAVKEPNAIPERF